MKTYTEKVAYFREHPPTVGACGTGYKVGFAGHPNLIFPKGSNSAAAYRAGKLNHGTV